MKPRPLCNRRDCTELVAVPSRVGFRVWEPCEPGEETGMCAKHAPRPLTPEGEAKARADLVCLGCVHIHALFCTPLALAPPIPPGASVT